MGMGIGSSLYLVRCSSQTRAVPDSPCSRSRILKNVMCYINWIDVVAATEEPGFIPLGAGASCERSRRVKKKKKENRSIKPSGFRKRLTGNYINVITARIILYRVSEKTSYRILTAMVIE